MMHTRQHTGLDTADLKQELLDEAYRLRGLAELLRLQSPPPVLEHYIRSGRGPLYQRDRDAWMKTTHVAHAFDEAASRLEQVLASYLGGGGHP